MKIKAFGPNGLWNTVSIDDRPVEEILFENSSVTFLSEVYNPFTVNFPHSITKWRIVLKKEVKPCE